MPTNLAIDDTLIVSAQRAGNHKTKRAAVTEALKEYILHRKQLKVIHLFNKIEYDPHFDYKKQRNRA